MAELSGEDLPVDVAWVVPPNRTMQRTDACYVVVFDETTGESWKINSSTALLLAAVAAGWKPGSPPPAKLQAEIHDNGLTPQDLIVALESLEGEGLVARRDQRADAGIVEVSSRGTGPRHRYRDLRWPILLIPASHGVKARLILWMGLALPPLSLCALAVATWRFRHGHEMPVVAHWIAELNKNSRWDNVIAVLAMGTLAAAAHELGHAVVNGAATGRPTWIGARLFWGIPQAFADIRSISTVPRRRDRLAILFAGTAAQCSLTIVVMLWALFSPITPPTIALWLVLVVGPFSALINLWPFYKTDGYFILQECVGLTNLGQKSRRAVGRMFATDRVETERALKSDDPWWLPWYGLFHICGVAAFIALSGALFARAVDWPPLGVMGLLATVAYLYRVYSSLQQEQMGPEFI